MPSPSPRPLPASLLPVSPDSKLLFWTGRAAIGLTPREIQGIIERAHSGDVWLDRPDISEGTALKALALAIDPETGDSVLHIAATFTGEPLAMQKVIRQTDERSCGLDHSKLRRERALESLLMHQNYAGDSALHIAACSGSQRAITFLYRTFCSDWSRDYLDKTAPPPLSDNDPTLPEFERGEILIDNNDCRKRLAFLLLPNEAGHTAADAARSAGHANVAVWLENIVILLDPDRDFKAKDIPDVIEEACWRHGE